MTISSPTSTTTACRHELSGRKRRLPQTGSAGDYVKQQLKDKLIEHKQYIDQYGQDLPEIRDWKWGEI